MLTAILATVAAICAVGWVTNWTGNAALVKWLLDKGYDPPTDEELNDSLRYVWRKLLRIK